MFFSKLHRDAASDFLSIVSDSDLRVSYSQFGEDLLLHSWVTSGSIEIANKFYVDVGAFHPSRFSNTKLLHLRGWSGLNIDPSPEAIELFQEARPNDINVNLGISERAGTADFFRFEESNCNTLSPDQANRAISGGRKFLGKEQIETAPLSTILDRHLPETVLDRGIGFLNIDCEGLDAEILLSLDLDRYRPAIVAIEAHNFDLLQAQSHPIVAKLCASGYMLGAYIKPTLMFHRVP